VLLAMEAVLRLSAPAPAAPSGDRWQGRDGEL